MITAGKRPARAMGGLAGKRPARAISRVASPHAQLAGLPPRTRRLVG